MLSIGGQTVRAILGVASAKISSLVLNLPDIWGICAGDVIEMLLAANSWPHCLAILDRTFLSKFKPTVITLDSSEAVRNACLRNWQKEESFACRFRKTFWARRLGVLTDRFGIPWAINCEKSK